MWSIGERRLLGRETRGLCARASTSMRADSCAMRAVTCWTGPGEMGGFQIEGAPALLESGARGSFSRENELMD